MRYTNPSLLYFTLLTVVVETCAISAGDTLINYFDWIIRDVDVHALHGVHVVSNCC